MKLRIFYFLNAQEFFPEKNPFFGRDTGSRHTAVNTSRTHTERERDFPYCDLREGVRRM